jgi:hypothetical protein
MHPIAFLRKLAELQRAQIAHGHPVREYLWLASILPEMSLQVPEKKARAE